MAAVTRVNLHQHALNDEHYRTIRGLGVGAPTIQVISELLASQDKMCGEKR